jgi:hypothetical protein
VNAEAAVHELEAEILQEMGGVLRKVEDKLNYKLLLLELAGKEISKACDSLVRCNIRRSARHAILWCVVTFGDQQGMRFSGAL